MRRWVNGEIGREGHLAGWSLVGGGGGVKTFLKEFLKVFENFKISYQHLRDVVRHHDEGRILWCKIGSIGPERLKMKIAAPKSSLVGGSGTPPEISNSDGVS